MSRNRVKAKQALQAEQGIIHKHRRDIPHTLSTPLVNSHDQIVMESVAVKALLETAPRPRARCWMARIVAHAAAYM
jgi:transposase